MSLRQIIRERRSDILATARQFGASKVRLFGSVAREEDTIQSDIDFLVELEPGRSLMDHAGLKLALEELLERSVDVATEKGLKPRFRERILREAVEV